MVQIPGKGSPHKDGERRDLRRELDELEKALDELKLLYEQYFTGILALPPDKLHAQVKTQIRHLRTAPFRSSELNFRLRSLQNRYQTFDTYFQRVMKQREAGVYSRDVFKANIREQFEREDAAAHTAKGAADRQMRDLFESYRSALETASGKKQEVDFEKFQKSLLRKAKEFKQKHGAKKLTFKVVVAGGKVTVQAKVRE